MRHKKRKVPQLVLATPAPTDREKIWTAMRQKKIFTQIEIVLLTGCEQGKVKDYLRGLIASGFVVKLGEPEARFTEATYELAKDIGVDAPRVRKDGTILPTSGRNRMWQAMRVLKVFTTEELVNTASLHGEEIGFHEARTYCSWLSRGGYLVQNCKTWYFIPAKFTGVKAPQILRIKVLFDPNLGEIVYQPKPEGRDDE